MPVGTQGAVKAITHRDLEDARRRDHPRQHLPPLSAARRRADRARAAACTGSSAGPSRSSPTAAATRCSASRDAPHDRRGGRARSGRTSTARAHLLTPEKAADIQAQLGSDIAMVLDECLAHPGRPRRGARSRWSGRCAGPARARDRLARAPRRRRCAGVDRRPIPARRSSASSRAASFPDLRERERAGDRRRSASRATRSAA